MMKKMLILASDDATMRFQTLESSINAATGLVDRHQAQKVC